MKEPKLRSKKIVLLGTISAAIFLGLFHFPTGEFIQDSFIRPSQFKFRRLLKKDPKLDKRIRVLSLDAETTSYLKNNELSLRDWMTVFSALSKTEPEAVYIDGDFFRPTKKEYASQLARRIKNYKFPVIASVLVNQNSIPGLKSLPKEQAFTLPIGKSALYPKFPRWNYAYAPEGMENISAHLGHNRYLRNGFSSYQVGAFLKVEGERLLPIAPFKLAKLELEEGKVYLDGKKVPIDLKGNVYVDHLYPSYVHEKTRSLMEVLRKTEPLSKNEFYSKGSIYVVLPNYYHDESDEIAGPFKSIPSSFLTVSLANSVLSKKWIASSNYDYPTIVAAAIVGAFVGVYFFKAFWLMLFAVAVGCCYAGLALFTYVGFEFAWAFTALSFFTSGLLVYREKHRITEKKLSKIKYGFEGLVSEETLEKMLHKPPTEILGSRTQVLTVMYVDIVGYSSSVERESPEKAMTTLKEILSEISSTVHKYGGVVNRTLGDGLVCLFGENENENQPHADDALDCSIEIQRENLKKNLERYDRDEAIFPVRIGINTDRTYVGDLGTANRVDLTLLGQGVNLAKKLEEVCEDNRILIGASTKDRLARSRAKAALNRRDLQVKRYADLVEAYELDPLGDREESLRRVFRSHRVKLGLERLESRWAIPPNVPLKVKTKFGDGCIVNFSQSGLAIELEQYLGRKVTFEMRLESKDSALESLLQKKGIHDFHCEVRWGRALDHGKSQMGILVKNLNPYQKRDFEKILREYVNAHQQKVAS